MSPSPCAVSMAAKVTSSMNCMFKFGLNIHPRNDLDE